MSDRGGVAMSSGGGTDRSAGGGAGDVWHSGADDDNERSLSDRWQAWVHDAASAASVQQLPLGP